MCTSPLYRVRDEFFDVVHLLDSRIPRVMGYEVFHSFLTQYPSLEKRVQQIPCGQCTSCRLFYSRQWADRLVLESMEYPDSHNWFLTLTFDDAHLPSPVSLVSCASGEVSFRFPLVPRELTLFMKRLRKSVGDGVRFYACGEYGDKNGRPHFHVILLNCPIPDAIPSDRFRVNREAGTSVLFESSIIDKAWQYRGLACLGRLSWHSCAYVARYVMKKMKGQSLAEFRRDYVVFDEKGNSTSFPLEFVRMSRRPGIASKFFDENYRDIYSTDSLYIPKGRSVERSKPSKYFDDRFKVINPDHMALVKSEREAVAIARRALELESTTLDEWSYLQLKEREKLDQLSRLHRF